MILEMGGRSTHALRKCFRELSDPGVIQIPQFQMKRISRAVKLQETIQFLKSAKTHYMTYPSYVCATDLHILSQKNIYC